MSMQSLSSFRLHALIHYVVWRCSSLGLGATKLNKILWFADVEAYRRFGHSISGATSYRKLQFGPVPHNMYGELGTVKALGLIAEAVTEVYGLPRKQFTALQPPPLDAFAAHEKALVDEIADGICRHHTAASISERSHDILWEEVPLGGAIPIEAAAIIFDVPTTSDVQWAESLLSRL